MIRDLERLSGEIPSGFDVCIVGAGPTGISLALALIDAGMKVCVAEGGGARLEASSQALYEGESIGHPMRLDEGRFRIFGGAATQWGGRCAMLDRIDFEARDWIPGSGWPITYDDLAPYYEQAKRISNFRQPWGGQEEAESRLGVELPRLQSPDVKNYVWRFAPPDISPSLKTYIPRGVYPPFEWVDAYRGRLEAARDSLVLLHANCVAIRPSEDGARVEAIEVRSLTGASMVIAARTFVLCASGIENARLLLNASPNLQKRINPHGALGRYFMQHPRGRIATIEADRAASLRLQRTYNHFWSPRWAGVRYATGFALTDDAQRRHKLLNASAFTFYNPDPAWEAGKRLGRSIKTLNVAAALKDAGAVLAAAPSLAPNVLRNVVTANTLIYRRPAIDVIMDCEQLPNPESRITLSQERDALGMRRSRVDWRFSEMERRTGRFLADAIGAELSRLGLGELKPAPWLTSDAPIRESDMSGTYHFIGATRMSNDPRTGVVDANCRAHGVQNLYLAGTSVMPTGGHANPTLTIVALALRLADHLRKNASADASPIASVAASRTDAASTILVTGAAGFIGGWVCDSLARAGATNVRAGVRTIGASEKLAALPVTQVQCDVFDRASLAEALQGVSVVINCARDGSRRDDAREAVENILAVGTPLGLKRLVQFSSAAVYGSATGAVDEDTSPTPPLDAYGADKRAADEFCRQWGNDISVAILRPGLVYGPGGEEWTGRFIRGIAAGRLQQLGADGAGDANLVYVGDLADFASLLALSDASGVFNVCAPVPPTFNEYFSLLSEAIGRGPLPTTTETAAARNKRRNARRIARALVSKAGRILPLKEMEAALRYDERDMPPGFFARRVTYKIERALAAGFSPRTSLADGIAASAAWARAQGLLK